MDWMTAQKPLMGRNWGGWIYKGFPPDPSPPPQGTTDLISLNVPSVYEVCDRREQANLAEATERWRSRIRSVICCGGKDVKLSHILYIS